MAKEARTRGVPVETAIFRGNAAEQICEASKTASADLIILAVERKGLLERAFLGTTAERVVREAKVPVLSIPVTASVLDEQEKTTCCS